LIKIVLETLYRTATPWISASLQLLQHNRTQPYRRTSPRVAGGRPLRHLLRAGR